MTKLFAVVADALSVPFLGAAPTAHADAYCELGNLLIPQEVHHVGTYRDATCATVADIVTTSDDSDCIRAVTNSTWARTSPFTTAERALVSGGVRGRMRNESQRGAAAYPLCGQESRQ